MSLKSNIEVEALSQDNSLPKWQLALLIGAPVAIGVGIGWWYIKRGNRNDGNDQQTKDKTDTNKVYTIPKVIDDGNLNNPYEKANALKIKGNQFFKGARYEQAIECYSDAIKLCPSDKTEELAIFYQNRAACYENLKNYQQLIDDCTKAIQLKNNYLKAYVRRAKAYEELNDLQNCLNDLTTACIIEKFQNQSNLINTDRILKMQSSIKAKEFFKTKPSHNPSKNFIQQYFSSYSHDPIIQDSNIPSNLKEFEELLESYTSQNGTETPKSILSKGTIYILKGDIENAEKELTKIAKLQECDKKIKVNTLIKLGTIKIQDISSKDSIDDALKWFDEAIKIDNENPDVYLHRAQIYVLTDKVDEALQDLNKCCTLNSSFPSAEAQKFYIQFRKGVKLNDFGAVNKSLKGFEKALEKFPHSSEILSLYAQVLMEQEKYEEADKCYVKAIEKFPTDGNLYVHRGIMHMQWGKMDDAIKFLEESKKADPSCQFAYEMLGSIEVQKGNIEGGIQNFTAALDLAQTELDCAHLFSLRDAAEAQLKASKALGIELPSAI